MMDEFGESIGCLISTDQHCIDGANLGIFKKAKFVFRIFGSTMASASSKNRISPEVIGNTSLKPTGFHSTYIKAFINVNSLIFLEYSVAISFIAISGIIVYDKYLNLFRWVRNIVNGNKGFSNYRLFVFCADNYRNRWCANVT